MEQFRFETTEIPGVIIIYPNVHGDARGYFMETYQKDLFEKAGITREFVQDNESSSSKGVLRGLHFQKNHTQGKLVRVTRGKVFDVAVDCRPNSPTFGKWTGVTLDEDVKNMFYIPEFVYKCTDIYDPSSEGGIPWNDPTINVQWPSLDVPYLTSAKDQEHPSFKDQSFDYFDQY